MAIGQSVSQKLGNHKFGSVSRRTELPNKLHMIEAFNLEAELSVFHDRFGKEQFGTRYFLKARVEKKANKRA